MADFPRASLTKALEDRRVVQATLIRSTIHLVSARDYWPFAVAIRRSRRDWWLRVHPSGPRARQMAALARRLRRQLGDGPLSRAEIDRLLGKGSVGTNGVGLWLDLVRVPPSGTWEQRRADLFATADDWIGQSGATVEDGLDHLLRRYLGGFGPASLKEAANWAGVHPSVLQPSTERLRLRRFRAEDGEELLDLPRAPLPDADAPAPPRFLPVWDATLLVHARRAQILPEQYRTRVFNAKTPHSMHTFLVDGRVAGAWKYERGRIQLEPFERLPHAARRALDDEAEQLAGFMR
jgi:hypothetical protein